MSDQSNVGKKWELEEVVTDAPLEELMSPGDDYELHMTLQHGEESFFTDDGEFFVTRVGDNAVMVFRRKPEQSVRVFVADEGQLGISP